MARELTQIEIDESRSVFGSSVNYNRIKVFEGARWPDWIAQAASRLGGSPAPTHNAVTLGNRLYFPTTLRTHPDGDGQFSLQDMAWLVHEITHAWQYQRQGWSYLRKAISAQVKLGADAYNYGWEQGLNEAVQRGDSLDDFNPEQQGEIARHFYYRQKQGLDTQAWDAFALLFKSP
ncbi:MAG: hypothetical protein PVF85_05140 [Anaerolineales bacterium]|jgi:hypothetical protein